MPRPLLAPFLFWVPVLLVACGSPRVAPDARDVGGDAVIGDGVAMCHVDIDCTDHVFCNGVELCMPGASGADARGCVGPSSANPCTPTQTCNEAMQRCDAQCGASPDADHDGHRSMACGGDDCDDNDPNRFPGNAEVCAVMMGTAGDGGVTLTRVDPMHDEDCDPTTFANSLTHDGDHDGDGYIDVACCNASTSGMPTCGDDCADLASVAGIAPFTTGALPQYLHPTSPEVCNGIDDNCNGRIDEMLPTGTYSRDCDGDGYGDHLDLGTMGCDPIEFPPCNGHSAVPNHTDCNDTSAAANPMASEVCDGLDNNCDGVIDGPMAAAACDVGPYAMTMACTAGACEVATCTTGHADCNHAAVDGCEIDTTTDVHHCGACGTNCPSTSGTPICGAGTCGYSSCTGNTYMCGTGGACIAPTVSACGNACTPCPTNPSNGMYSCPSGACVLTCAAGYAQVSAACVAINLPRQIAPLSTATVTSQQPTLRWALAATYDDGAHIQLCRDRAMSTACITIDAIGTSWAPTAPLAAGWWYWQIAGRYAAASGTTYGPIWQFLVGHRSAPVNTSWGTVPDFNGDGYADVVVQDNSAAYVYMGGAAGLATTPARTITPGGVASGEATSAGDVNGDGFADLIVGGVIYFGGTSGVATTSAVTVAGTSFASAGDVNGDGYGDVITGTPSTNSAALYEGRPGGPSSSPTATLPYGGSVCLLGCGFGVSVAAIGDANGDGFGDIVVGSTSWGASSVYYGSSAGLGPQYVFRGGSVTFNTPVASAGDVNGDGYADVMVGGRTSVPPEGRVWLLHGSATGVATAGGTILGLPASSTNDQFGDALGSADINGDGFSDLVIGAYGVTSNTGQAFIYQGGAGAFSTTPATTLAGPATGSNFGFSVAGAGDITGDGYADVVVGAEHASVHGQVFVYSGTAAGLSTTSSPTLTGTGTNFGAYVASLDRTASPGELMCRARVSRARRATATTTARPRG